MKKNVASQVIGAQLITAADGTEFTGAVKTETASIQADTNDIQTRIPAALDANDFIRLLSLDQI